MLAGYLERRRRLCALRDLPLFADCSRRELRTVAGLGTVVSIGAGERLIVQGKGARECCVLLEGDAEVRASGEIVAVLRPGSLVGELSLLTNSPRPATVVARTPVRAMVFDGAAFANILSSVPSTRSKVLGDGAQATPVGPERVRLRPRPDIRHMTDVPPSPQRRPWAMSEGRAARTAIRLDGRD